MKLEIHGVDLEIAGNAIVAGATLSVASGEVAGLIGPNGSGKTTLCSRHTYWMIRVHAG